MTTTNEFQSFTEIEHVRKRSDMYIGPIKNISEVRWLINSTSNEEEEAIQDIIEYNPGLEQCILELIVNAADHVERCKSQGLDNVTRIKVEMTKESVTVTNNGPGIPIEIHPKTKLYVPEMIFGHLRTSSNYDDNTKRAWGGRNGLGAKAANIFSTKFIIEIQTGGQKYVQEFTKGMTSRTKPVITSSKKVDSTKITYYPDFEAFGMTNFDSNATERLIEKRVYDISAATGKETTVYYNDKKIPIKDFSDYMTLYIGDKPRVLYKTDRWEVGFALCPYDQPTQISFVNCISTDEGGTHVTHVLDPVLTKITEEMQLKSKGVTIKKQYIKDNTIIFIKALIDNPTFSSQLKRKLETKVGDFGSRCDVPEAIIKKVAKLGICDNVLEIAKAKEMANAMKKIDGTKKVRLTDIKKLEDANLAGTTKSMECTLLLVEGDSSKGMALNGITSAGGRDKWGVFPLRGKFINIRTATATQLINNEEINSVNRILGLKEGLKDIKKLRYGRVMLFTDSDFDGSHIQGLLINYFTYYWPEIVEDGLLEKMITPLVKVFKSNKLLNQFYSLNDYKKWVTENNPQGTREKYYKGLGTSSAAEAKEYFSDLKSNRKKFTFKEIKDTPLLLRTFDKEYADERKEWITGALKNPLEVDYNKQVVPVDYFINREFVQFSIYDNIRSIPNVIDGFKPSQRKILYACLKKKLFIKSDGSGELKVAQLSGYVAEQSMYHHGETSLQGAIVAMAQDFVGSNNFNLLLPTGNFGSRLLGGADAASPRYIHTALRPEVKIIFNETDNQLLKYIEEEGTSIEPEFYVPIVPMLLINGSTGIGTGWSTNIPCFKMEDIIHNIKKLLKDEDAKLREMNPWYKGFKGKIIKLTSNSWKSQGVIKWVDKHTIDITELPIGMWKQDFKEYLDKLLDSDSIKSVVVNDKDAESANDVCYRIRLKESIIEEDVTDLIGFFKLEKAISGNNMVAFDEKCVIQRYGSVEDIIWTFFVYRLDLYKKRKEYLEKTLTDQIQEISERLRFVILVIDDKIVIFKRRKAEIKEVLEEYKFASAIWDNLLSMKLHQFTQDEVEKLEKELSELKQELEILQRKTHKDLWIEDLDSLITKCA